MTLPRRFLARSLLAAFALGLCVPLGVRAQPQPSQAPIQVPTPAPMPTITGTPLPYPAYGSPAPDVAAQKQRPGIPVTVSLKQAIDIAAAQSPAFASERAAYRAIAAKYGAEKGALLPAISGSASITRDYGSNSSRGATPLPSSSPGNVGYTTTESAGLTLSELIYDGGQVIAGIRSAKEADIAGRDTLLRELQTLAFNVATDYYALLEDNASVASDAALVREFVTNEQYVSAEIRTGAAARSDLAAAQFETAQARGALVTAQGAAIQAQATFATVLGLDADTAISPQVLGTSPPQARLLSYSQALQLAYTLRPDFLAAEHTVESDKEGLRFAKLARFPSLTANASTGTAREQVPGYQTPFASTSSIGATLTVPIYDQGLTNYNVAVAAATLDEASAAMTTERLTVQSDVRGGLANLISARANLVQAQAEVTSATVSLQATQAQYKVGASTITAIVTAEANLATAQTAYVAALYGERQAEALYSYDLGASDLSL
ncbi:MAG TPA: TolC family protein [Candidatus Baltobacteraceae bacterium]|nr:TolC family protein [Candidatus Baltobacteraceae bacterium]